MKIHDASSDSDATGKNQDASHHLHRGFIVFCETNLRYEKGFKAWIFLGPYLIGAAALEMVIVRHSSSATHIGPWIGVLAYLVLFPLAWRRVLKFIASKRISPVISLR